jgi:redox-sensitive bicupin YhaK (pirin superfamily)
MKKYKLRATDRGEMKHDEFHGFTIFNLGEPGTERPGNFGPLYVFNDDTLFPGSFLGMHPHANVEIVTVMLAGEAGEESHEDTLGIHDKYVAGDVQLISAGSGIRHSGGNTSDISDARHLQIWVQPRHFDTPPHVSVLKKAELDLQAGSSKLLVSPDGQAGSLRINQHIWISHISIEAGTVYELVSRGVNNGLMIYHLGGGTFTVIDEHLEPGDTLFVLEWDKLELIAGDTEMSVIIIETEIQDR